MKTIKFNEKQAILLLSISFILNFFVGCATVSNGGILQSQILKAKSKVVPALVHLNPVQPVYKSGKKEEVIVIGSGFIISKDGYLITNEHVVGDSKKVKCILSDKREMEAEVIGTDPFTDVAVLKLPAQEKYPFVTLGDSDRVKTGDIVLAMGSPHGLSRSVSMGIVSMTDRCLEDNISIFNNFIQTDAAINQGNSGGPLVNLKGEVIGINSRKLVGADNVGFATPINIAKEVVDSIIKYGKVNRSWLGLNLQEMKAITEDANKKGVVIADVEIDSPAYKAGIHPGDILLAINNEPVHARFREDLPYIRKKLANLEIGKEVELTILQGDKEEKIKVIPEPYSPYKGQEIEFTEWGFTASEITNEMMKRLKLPSKKGIYVSGVQDGSIAKISGLLAGDIILEIEGKPVENMEEFMDIYKKVNSNEQQLYTLLFVQRGVVTRYILVKKLKDEQPMSKTEEGRSITNE